MEKSVGDRLLPEHIGNDDAYRLGEIANLVSMVPAGDYIDTGLALRRLMEERGYWLCRTREREPSTDPALPSLATLREKAKTYVPPAYISGLIAAARLVGWDTEAGLAIRAEYEKHTAA